jgi:cell division protein FtsI (penicillin-binding protein 3)/stage V sporulation protein D (sporulation-specific penicillin-binding protein)
MKLNKFSASPARKHVGEWRIGLLAVVVLLLAGGIIYRLFTLTFLKHESFVRIAKSQYTSPTAMLEGRSDIYFSDSSQGVTTKINGRGVKIAATNKTSLYLYVNSDQITEEMPRLAEKLSLILGQPVEETISKINEDGKNYKVIATDIQKVQAEQITKLNIKGLGVASEIERFYPMGKMAGQSLGFVGFNGSNRSGQYGLEAYYDEILSGVEKTQEILGNNTYSKLSRFFSGLFGAKKNEQKSEGNNTTNKQEGKDIILSLDKDIQLFIEDKLSETLKKWNAVSGTIIVQDPKTGKILAMTSSPSYDPNNYSQYQFKDFLDPAHQEIYEPGSSFKPITMAAAINSGAVTPNTRYFDTGEAKFGTYVIRNFDEKSHGSQTMSEVLQKSLNTGVIFAQNKTGSDQFLNHVVAFGFGQKTGVDLGGEISGNISNLYSGREINLATAAFGQGVAVTPLQLINAYSAIANGGKLMKPQLAESIIRPDGATEQIKPEIIGAPISEETARQMQKMLVDVVDKGFDKARIKGYDIAGKTGTAQIPGGDGGYLTDDQFIHNFVGFAPAYSARFAVLIKIDKPQGIKFAADSLSPVFGDISRYLIRHFNVPPTR